MEDYLAFGIFTVVLLGYVGLSAAVGVYAYKRDRSFLLYFLLSLFVSPVPIFFLVLFLNAVTQSTGTDVVSADQLRSNLEEQAERLQQERSSDETAEEDSASMEEPTVEEPTSEESVSGKPDEDEGDTIRWEEEGKVRCSTCYSRVDETASQCPACGAKLESSGGFF